MDMEKTYSVNHDCCEPVEIKADTTEQAAEIYMVGARESALVYVLDCASGKTEVHAIDIET